MAIEQASENIVLRLASYVRSPFLIVIGLLFTMASCLNLTVATFLQNRALDNWIIRTWARVTCWVMGIKIELEGEENIPEGGCLFLFNHSSHFDIPIMHASIVKHHRFGAKAELYKIPIFGTTLKRMGVLPIHRGDRERVYKLYQESIPRIEAGESFALAPEGTRQEQPAIGRFKKGPFLFAVSAKAPVVPVVIKGALELLPKGHLFPNQGRWRRRVKVRILPPHPTASLEMGDELKLQSEVHEAMVKAYEEIV